MMTDSDAATDTDLCRAGIGVLGRLIREREVSPVEVVTAHLARCTRLNSALNAFITIDEEGALTAARAAEHEIASGGHRGPLHGVPIGVKDCIATVGLRTTYGSQLYAGKVPTRDAHCVARLREAGAIILGKANLHEFASGSTSNNPWFGTARSPWDPERSPGGSSGGSGAAVAAFLVPGALGTDTGGSVRAPAACNGVFGLKPTYGLVSLSGVFPNSWSLDTVGPLAREVADLALLLQGMAGFDADDPSSVEAPAADFAAELGFGAEGLRIALGPDLHVTEIDDAVLAGIDEAAGVLRRLGAEVTRMAWS